MLEKEFISIIDDIIKSPEFQKMKKYKHHINGNLFDHSVKVAHLCYKHHKRFGTKIDIKELVIGALLHDYYLYDLHGDGRNHSLHWFKHPKIALEKASAKYPLTRTQKDMIAHHMFPLTIIPPKTRAGWIVCLYDKVGAISDRFGKNQKNQKNFKINKI